MDRGNFDNFGSGEVIGWAIGANDSSHVSVGLYIDGEFICEQLADSYRRDLEEHGLGDGRYAFFIRIPKKYFDDKVHRYEVKIMNRERISIGNRIASFRPQTNYPNRGSSKLNSVFRRK